MTAGSVVLVSLGATPPGEALLAGVHRLQETGHRVTLISRTPPVRDLAETLDLRVPVGRPVLLGAGGQQRISKIVMDPHRLPGATQILLDGTTRRLVTSADVLVAVDAAALPATWLAARVNRRAIAVNGLPAALARLDR
ncbi:MAG: hypothetical protein QG622_129 [Actinomycetota bacterium]|nr:hypothetical protein [Actinomycetota bacterium]